MMRITVGKLRTLIREAMQDLNPDLQPDCDTFAVFDFDESDITFPFLTTFLLKLVDISQTSPQLCEKICQKTVPSIFANGNTM